MMPVARGSIHNSRGVQGIKYIRESSKLRRMERRTNTRRRNRGGKGKTHVAWNIRWSANREEDYRGKDIINLGGKGKRI